MNKFDIAFVGAGPGGYVTAIKAAELGYKVVIFEKEYIGGVCLNVGCIPTKALLKSAHLLSEINEAESFGIKLADKLEPTVDWQVLMARKDDIVEKLTSNVKILLRNKGITLVEAFAEILDAKRIKANDTVYEAKNIILAMGSSPSFPNVKGLQEAFQAKDVVCSTGMLSLKAQPKKLLVIGGGVIALEFATIFNALGTDVTILQRSKTILSGMDKDVRKTMQRVAVKAGINVITDTKLLEVQGKTVKFEKGGKVLEETGDVVLVSMGRSANTKGIEALNLEMNKNSVKVDEYYQTSLAGVYAIGDMSSPIKLAHMASAEGFAALDHIMGKPRIINYDRVPACVYGFPEAASIGLTEEQVKEKGIEYKVAKFRAMANGKSLASGDTDGVLKIITDEKIGEILGVHIVGGVATDLISQALMVMELEGTAHEIANAVFPHPTNSEMLAEAAHIIEGYPIHVSVKK